MSQHHYAVVYDTATRKWSLDDEAAADAWPDGVIYDNERDTWHHVRASDSDVDEMAGDVLLLALKNLSE
jgi:hypothetical protein